MSELIIPEMGKERTIKEFSTCPAKNSFSVRDSFHINAIFPRLLKYYSKPLGKIRYLFKAKKKKFPFTLHGLVWELCTKASASTRINHEFKNRSRVRQDWRICS